MVNVSCMEGVYTVGIEAEITKGDQDRYRQMVGTWWNPPLGNALACRRGSLFCVPFSAKCSWTDRQTCTDIDRYCRSGQTNHTHNTRTEEEGPGNFARIRNESRFFLAPVPPFSSPSKITNLDITSPRQNMPSSRFFSSRLRGQGLTPSTSVSCIVVQCSAVQCRGLSWIVVSCDDMSCAHNASDPLGAQKMQWQPGKR